MATSKATKHPKYEKEPDKFPWESPEATGSFWADIPRLGQSFLKIYGAEELAKLELDKIADQTKDERVAYLRALIQKKIADQEAETSIEDMTEDEFKLHRQMGFALSSTYSEVGKWLPAREVGAKMNEDYESKMGKADVGGVNILAYCSERMGDWEAAEKYYKLSLPLMKTAEILGPDSPQALGTMRGLMLIYGKQGRLKEALELNKEGYEVIETMKGGRFKKYAEEETEAMDALKEVFEEAERQGKPVDPAWRPAWEEEQ